MKGKRPFRGILALVLALFLCAGTVRAEAPLPPSPEPPEGKRTDRPTPAPTEMPEETVIDHIHNPKLLRNFYFHPDRKLLEIWFPNIQDADEAVLIYDGRVVLIDCGDNRAGARGAAMIRTLGVEKIDVLFNSHPHHDHIDGLARTHQAAAVGEIRICFPADSTESGKRMVRTAEELGIPVTQYGDGDTFAMGDGAVELLFLQNSESWLDMNNRSAVARVTYGKRSILFLADMERYGQEAMYARVDRDLLKCDIVKYPHHAKSDMDSGFFEAMGAKLAVVTSVEGRGDPGQLALERRELPAAYTAGEYYTRLVTDGEYWLCEQVPIR